MAEAIEEYFAKCDTGVKMPATDRKGNPIVENGEVVYAMTPEPYTMEELALHLDISHKVLCEYAQRGPFREILSRARGKIRSQWVKRSLTGQFNPKVACLLLAAHDETYRINTESNHNVRISIEDKLRQIDQAIPEAETVSNKALPGPDEDVVDAEVG